MASATNESHSDNMCLYTHHCNVLALLNHQDVNYSSTWKLLLKMFCAFAIENKIQESSYPEQFLNLQSKKDPKARNRHKLQQSQLLCSFFFTDNVWLITDFFFLQWLHPTNWAHA